MFTWILIQLGFIDRWVLTKFGTQDGEPTSYSIHIRVCHYDYHARWTVLNMIRDLTANGWFLEKGYVPGEVTRG